MTTAFQSNAFQRTPLAFQIDSSVVVVDTHDGEDERKKKREAAARRREQIAWYSDHPGEPMPQEIVAQTMLLAVDDPDLKELMDAYAKKKERQIVMVLMLL